MFKRLKTKLYIHVPEQRGGNTVGVGTPSIPMLIAGWQAYKNYVHIAVYHIHSFIHQSDCTECHLMGTHRQ